MTTIIKHSSYFIPIAHLSKSAIADAKERFTFRFYKENMCRMCEYLPDRFNEDTCGQCVNYEGGVQLAKVESIGAGQYLSLPRGASEEVKKWLKQNDIESVRVVDKTPGPKPMSKKFKFTGTLADYQEEAVEKFPSDRKNERGLIESPARSGKTVMAAAFIARRGEKALIICHQREWLLGFQETFIGSATQPALTSAEPSQVQFCSSYEDFEKADVALATFQQFWNDSGMRVLKRIASMFSIVIIDEVQFAASPESRKVLRKLNANHVIGVTGTVERKDKKHVLSSRLIGSVKHKVLIERLKPTVRLLETGLTFETKSNHRAAFLHMERRMHSDTKRTDLIVKKAVSLAKEGHFVILPMKFVDQVLRYASLINDEAEAEDCSVSNSEWARIFHGKLNKKLRAKTIEDARQGKFKILVANIKLISVGVNIPRASALIDRVGITSNLPMTEQRVSRILTKIEGKQPPVLVCIVDRGKQLSAMFANEYYNAITKMNPIVDSVTANRIREVTRNRDTFSLKDIQ